MSNLSGETISDTFSSIFHLQLPYTIGDSRMEYIPVYVDDGQRTSLSISKNNIKIGNYVYPSTGANGCTFYLKNNQIVSNDKFILNEDADKKFRIGDNVFDFSELTSTETTYILYKENGVISCKEFYDICTISSISISTGKIDLPAGITNIICSSANWDKLWDINTIKDTFSACYTIDGVTTNVLPGMNYINIPIRPKANKNDTISITLSNISAYQYIINQGAAAYE